MHTFFTLSVKLDSLPCLFTFTSMFTNGSSGALSRINNLFLYLHGANLFKEKKPFY